MNLQGIYLEISSEIYLIILSTIYLQFLEYISEEKKMKQYLEQLLPESLKESQEFFFYGIATAFLNKTFKNFLQVSLKEALKEFMKESLDEFPKKITGPF